MFWSGWIEREAGEGPACGWWAPAGSGVGQRRTGQRAPPDRSGGGSRRVSTAIPDTGMHAAQRPDTDTGRMAEQQQKAATPTARRKEKKRRETKRDRERRIPSHTRSPSHVSERSRPGVTWSGSSSGGCLCNRALPDRVILRLRAPAVLALHPSHPGEDVFCLRTAWYPREREHVSEVDAPGSSSLMDCQAVPHVERLRGTQLRLARRGLPRGSGQPSRQGRDG
ncbi:hypothetical protein M432DRAFT_368505 [Thermoascus aurantiacus ATCC 26904]